MPLRLSYRCLLGCLGLALPLSARAQSGPLTINIVVTVTTTPSGSTTVTVGTAPTNPAAPVTTPVTTPVSTPVTSPVTTTPISTGGGSGGSASTGNTSPNTPGCTSNYPAALTTLTTFTRALQQVMVTYQADHAAGVISDSAFKAGYNNLLGIGLDAGAAHDMIQIGGDAADITTQIATVQGELATVTNADLVTLVAQMQSALVSASAAVSGSASCAVSVAP